VPSDLSLNSARKIVFSSAPVVHLPNSVLIRDMAYNNTNGFGCLGLGIVFIILLDTILRSVLGDWIYLVSFALGSLLVLLVCRILCTGVYVGSTVIQIRWKVRSFLLEREQCAGIKWEVKTFSIPYITSIIMKSGSSIYCPFARSETSSISYVGGQSGKKAYSALAQLLGEVE
jgi:hypothetical protein